MPERLERMRKEIEASEEEAGKSKKEAKRISYATMSKLEGKKIHRHRKQKSKISKVKKVYQRHKKSHKEDWDLGADVLDVIASLSLIIGSLVAIFWASKGGSPPTV